MMRANFAYNKPKQHVGPGACVDPNNKLYTSGEDSDPGMCEDGAIVAPNAGGGSGTFGQVNLNATWQFNISGAYQLPLGFTVAGNYFGRQGYPIAYYITDTAVRDGGSRVYVTAVDTFRYGWVSQLDLRLEKNIPITATISATIGLDCFNVLNLNTVTQRNARLNVNISLRCRHGNQQHPGDPGSAHPPVLGSRLVLELPLDSLVQPGEPRQPAGLFFLAGSRSLPCREMAGMTLLRLAPRREDDGCTCQMQRWGDAFRSLARRCASPVLLLLALRADLSQPTSRTRRRRRSVRKRESSWSRSRSMSSIRTGIPSKA